MSLRYNSELAFIVRVNYQSFYILQSTKFENYQISRFVLCIVSFFRYNGAFGFIMSIKYQNFYILQSAKIWKLAKTKVCVVSFRYNREFVFIISVKYQNFYILQFPKFGNK